MCEVLLPYALEHIDRTKLRGRGNVAGVANRYGLDGKGLESQWGQGFSHPYKSALGPN